MKFMAARWSWTAVVVAMIALAVSPAAQAVWFDLPTSEQKCVSEELRNNVVVLTDYYAFVGDDYDANNTITPQISVKVTSPFGNVLHQKEKVSHGQFSFTTTESGNYLACFTGDPDYHGAKKVIVGVDWKTGIATKDWESIAKKEKVEGLELELVKLTETIKAIGDHLEYLKEWEAEMRGVSEKTNARVARCSIVSLGVCVAVSGFQVWFLQRYFQKKRLI